MFNKEERMTNLEALQGLHLLRQVNPINSKSLIFYKELLKQHELNDNFHSSQIRFYLRKLIEAEQQRFDYLPSVIREYENFSREESKSGKSI